MKGWWDMWLRLNLISRIAVGLVLGVLVGAAVQGTAVAPQVGTFATLIGGLFVGALRSVAPVLVFLLVISAIARHRQGTPTHIRPILLLYLAGTFLAALAAVTASFLFPSFLPL